MMNNKKYIEGLRKTLDIKLVRSTGKSLWGLQIIHHESILSILKRIFVSNPEIKFFQVSSTSLSILSQFEYRTFRELICQELFMQVKCSVDEPLQGSGKAEIRETLLPRILDENKQKLYTLVLDLDETLVHSVIDEKYQSQIFVRPGAREFIKEMSKYYELVLFTAGTERYADWALSYIDPEKCIRYCLSREHTIQKGPICVKDISKIGRNLRRVIIIDNVVENFQLQPHNGIFIKSWTNDEKDDSLPRLTPLLKQIVEKKVKDVRVALRHYRDSQMRKLIQGKQDKEKSH